ncbi:MAG TPA: hypothetical protein VEW46_14800 [Pyrinomonadaceae bacterium]|nr:hypothetical protein [Pyrinomonadaceae bacterium]
MATKQTKNSKKKKKKTSLDGGDTPITIGGGGGGTPRVTVPVKITYDPNAWVPSVPPGTLTMAGGKVKKVTISVGEFELKLPVNGAVAIDLSVGKP